MASHLILKKLLCGLEVNQLFIIHRSIDWLNFWNEGSSFDGSMGIKLYKGVKIMAHGTHHNISNQYQISCMVTLVDAMILHTFIRIINKLRYHSVVFLQVPHCGKLVPKWRVTLYCFIM